MDNRSCSPKPAEPPAKKSRGEEQEQKEVKGEDVQTDKEQEKDVRTDKGEQELVQQAEEQKDNQTDKKVQEEDHKEVQKEGQPEKELQGAEEQKVEQEMQTDKEEQKEAQGSNAVKGDAPEGSNEKQEVSPLPPILTSLSTTLPESFLTPARSHSAGTARYSTVTVSSHKQRSIVAAIRP